MLVTDIIRPKFNLMLIGLVQVDHHRHSDGIFSKTFSLWCYDGIIAFKLNVKLTRSRHRKTRERRGQSGWNACWDSEKLSAESQGNRSRRSLVLRWRERVRMRFNLNDGKFRLKHHSENVFLKMPSSINVLLERRHYQKYMSWKTVANSFS